MSSKRFCRLTPYTYNMSAGVQPEKVYRPWVITVAWCIRDPVIRLRFLRAVALRYQVRRRRLLRLLFSSLVLAAILASLFVFRATPRVRPVESAARPLAPPAVAKANGASAAAKANAAPAVWLVENGDASETYSNGLHIDNHFAVSNHARAYTAFPKDPGQPRPPVRCSQPIGIVFHSTESLQVPFEARENSVLKRLGESLLEYVRRRRAYHFVIDRFGRVYRVVNETDSAEHAGYSVWADQQWEYVNLNESFLGVAFEAQTSGSETDPGSNPGQLRSGAMLVEMLRSRYQIPVTNCVTHAQVSVNPDNMRVGYHIDWAQGFPFEKLDLPDNYAQPLPSVMDFGFEPDQAFIAAAGPGLRTAIGQSEAELQQRAAAVHLSTPGYRETLRRHYHALLVAQPLDSSSSPSNSGGDSIASQQP